MSGTGDLYARGFFTSTKILLNGGGRKSHYDTLQRTNKELTEHAAFMRSFRSMVELGVQRGYLHDDAYDGISEATFEREYHELVWDETEEEFKERVKDMPPVTFRKVIRPPDEE